MNTIETYTIDYYIYTLNNGTIIKSTTKDNGGIKTNIKVSITKDTHDIYTAFLYNKSGGPIICDKNLESLKTKFIDALDACFLVETFMSINKKI